MNVTRGGNEYDSSRKQRAIANMRRIDFKTEIELQKLIEQNLEEILGCRFVAADFYKANVHSGRIDSLALSEDEKPGVIEYQKFEVPNFVNQGHLYLKLISDHKAAGGYFESGERQLAPGEIMGRKAKYGG